MKEVKQVVLITGCSSGFGYLTARLLAQSGYQVYATVRKTKDLHCFSDLPSQHRPQALLLDVTWDQSKINQVIKTITRKEKHLHVLVNNAGFGYLGALGTMTDQEFRHQFETNVFGLFKVTKAVLPIMRQQKQGLIINLSSIFGLVSTLCYGAYSASKFAVEALSQTLRLEEAPFNIKVTTINPGSFETAFRQKEKFPQANDQTTHPSLVKLNQKIKTLLHRPRRRGNPQKVASLILKIIKTPRPRPNYLIGFDAHLIYFLSRFLPLAIYEQLTRLIRHLR